MATVNEQIVTGRKFRKLIDETNKLWQRISIWTKASDVEFDDGENAETKLSAINGITDSLTSTSSNIAASAAAVKALNDKITELNSDLKSQIPFYVSKASMKNSGQWDSCIITLTYLYDCEISGVLTSASENTINGCHTAGSTTELSFGKVESTDMTTSISIDISNMKIAIM